jgi:hypothetical protein
VDSHTLEGLTLRLETAERGLRAARRAMWLGSILVVLAIGGAAWWLGGRLQVGGTPEVVEAQRFVVRDAQGEARAVLEAMPSGGTQLVFFRDPLPGETWRERETGGPFSFAVRVLSAHSQLMLGNRDGDSFQLSPANLFWDSPQGVKLLLGSDSGKMGIMFPDSTGMKILDAGLLADILGKSSTKASPPPKQHRRKR